MNRRQARVIAEIIAGSYLVQTDTPDEIRSLSGNDHAKVMDAQHVLGARLLAKHGVCHPVCADTAVSIAYGGKTAGMLARERAATNT